MGPAIAAAVVTAVISAVGTVLAAWVQAGRDLAGAVAGIKTGHAGDMPGNRAAAGQGPHLGDRQQP
jgi:hypothetical protein